MKNWFTDNSKWLLTVVSFIGGVLFGVFTTVLRYESKLEVLEIKLESKIERAQDAVSDLENVIQNRVLTKPKGE